MAFSDVIEQWAQLQQGVFEGSRRITRLERQTGAQASRLQFNLTRLERKRPACGLVS